MEMKHWTPKSWLRKERETLLPQSRQFPDPYMPSGFYSSLMRMQQDFDRVFSSLPSLWRQESTMSSVNAANFIPDMDILEKDKEYCITLEVPGIEEKDIHVKLEADEIIIRGEKRKEEESTDTGYHRVERSYGSFQRILTLPTNADRDSVNASFKNGVLTVTIAKTEAAIGVEREITIKVA